MCLSSLALKSCSQGETEFNEVADMKAGSAHGGRSRKVAAWRRAVFAMLML